MAECNSSGHQDKLPPPLDPFVFERLNAAVDHEQAQAIDRLQKQALDELGREIRQWRLEHGFPRAVLAARLAMDVNQLLCLENGIARAGDITAGQLASLQALVGRPSATPPPLPAA